MYEYINKEELFNKLFLAPNGKRIPLRDVDNFPTTITIEELRKVILRFPTIDAVEVVRCKDCKYCECLQDSFKNNFYFCINTINIAEVKTDDYCSYGVRKEDEGK